MHSNSLQRTPASYADDEGGLTEMHLFGTNKSYTAFYFEKFSVSLCSFVIHNKYDSGMINVL